VKPECNIAKIDLKSYNIVIHRKNGIKRSELKPYDWIKTKKCAVLYHFDNIKIHDVDKNHLA